MRAASVQPFRELDEGIQLLSCGDFLDVHAKSDSGFIFEKLLEDVVSSLVVCG